MLGGDKISEQTFEVVSRKLQEELADILKNNKQVNDYELIVYKYVFISELKIPLLEDLGVEIDEDSFILYIVPDGLEFGLLRKLDDVFDRFDISFMPNEYNILKLKFRLSD
ncbi:hypothetical protein [uncultured Methanobrevibacter sp.]|uniref:hypothetical protein n=1 Tax=uncultured Methanobrevibacter sp. TaxID=253161 RepID=UPI002622D7E8|nr:hypothetical protein [uncultured Methanobrevibacter sp.]